MIPVLAQPGPGILPGFRQLAFFEHFGQLIQRRHRGQGLGFPQAAHSAAFFHEAWEKPPDVGQLA